MRKTAKSKSTLTLGGLTARYKDWIEGLRPKGPNDWVYPQEASVHPIECLGIATSTE